MDDCSSVSLKGDIAPSSCTVDKLDIPSAKSPDPLSSQYSKMSFTTHQNNNTNNNDTSRNDKLVAEDRSTGTTTEDLEPALRRSKRGKGRPSNNHSNNNNNDGSSDDHVPSCTISGVEYRTGDFVYYEEPDFEYYTIGLIEEIKVSRRDKFSVFIKCFYRTRDIPEISKQALPDRDSYPTNSNVKLIRDIFSRELFVSEVQETLPAKQLRGICKVNYLPDLKTALNTFSPNEDDSFFYVFAYNPETRRLSKIRAEIRVGQAYQAALPEFRHPPPAIYRFCNKHYRFRSRRRRTTVVIPTSHKSDEEISRVGDCLRTRHSLSPASSSPSHNHCKQRRIHNSSTTHELAITDTSNNAEDNAGFHCNTISFIGDNDADGCAKVSSINKKLENIHESPENLDRFEDDNIIPCRTELTIDLSEDIKENLINEETESIVQKLDPIMNTTVQISNLPPKLENANDFKETSITAVNTDYSNHHHRRRRRHHHDHCIHRKNSYTCRQSHRRKRRRHQRHRKSQKREILVWSPFGLSSALSGNCKLTNLITNINDDDDDDGDDDCNTMNTDVDNTNTILNNISSDFNSMLSDEPLKNYLDAVRSMVAFFGFGGAEDDLASAENGLVLANLAATTQHAYDTLHKCNYSLRNALQAISCHPIVAKDTPRHWTADQVRLFAHALRIHGKDFFTIQRNFFGGKTSNNSTTTINNNNNMNSTNFSGLWNSNQIGTSRLRGRGRRKLPSVACLNPPNSKLPNIKSDEIESSSITTSVMNRLDEVKSEDATFVPTSECSHDGGESVENNFGTSSTTLKHSITGDAGVGSISSSSSSGLPVTSEPVKTVKELIAFYYYWKRKGTSSSSLGGGHGGLSAAAANFATAVVAAALNTDNIGINVNSTNGNSSSTSTLATKHDTGDNSNGNLLSSQTHFNSSAVKKRKATNRGCVLTKQAWLGIIEYRKAAEYELRRLLTLKAEKSGYQSQATVNYPGSTQISDDKLESIGPNLPESEVEEISETANTGVDGVDAPLLNSIDKNEDGTPISTGSDGNTDSMSTNSRLCGRLCRNCSAELTSSEDTPPLNMLGQLRFLCSGCRIHLQKYGELKCTSEKDEAINSLSTDVDAQNTDLCNKNLLNTTHQDQKTTVKDKLFEVKPLKFNSIPNTPSSSYEKHKRHLFCRLKHESHHRYTESHSCHDSSTTVSSPSSPCSLKSYIDAYYSASASSLSSSPRSSQLEDSDVINSDYDESSSSITNSSCQSFHDTHNHELTEVKSETDGYHLQRKRKRSQPCYSEGKKLINDDNSYLSKPPPKLDENIQIPYMCMKNHDIEENKYGVTSHRNKLESDDFDHHEMVDNKSILSSSGIHSSSNFIDSRDTKGHISNMLYSNNNHHHHHHHALHHNNNDQKQNCTEQQSSFIGSMIENHNQLMNNDQDDQDSSSSSSIDEYEVNKLMSATNESKPSSCFIDAHRSTWSHLVRIWDRKVHYAKSTTTATTSTSADSSVHLQTNTGTCARTDLIYFGRGLDIPLNNREFWNTQKYNLYTKYSDTAIGPGVNTFLSSTVAPPSQLASSPSTAAVIDHQITRNDAIKSETLNLFSPTTCYAGGNNNSFTSSIPYHPSSVMMHDTSSTALDLCARTTKRTCAPSSTSCSSEQQQQHQPHTKTRRSFQTDPIVNNSYLHSTGLTMGQIGVSSPQGGIRSSINNIPNQQQLQTIYEQALLFAAAAAGHYQHSPVREGCKFFPSYFELNNP
ncbi:unnamed protein product [Heterobilharzia americana]|nr:unnamed protein product [Heterobilharzia americana]